MQGRELLVESHTHHLRIAPKLQALRQDVAKVDGALLTVQRLCVSEDAKCHSPVQRAFLFRPQAVQVLHIPNPEFSRAVRSFGAQDDDGLDRHSTLHVKTSSCYRGNYTIILQKSYFPPSSFARYFWLTRSTLWRCFSPISITKSNWGMRRKRTSFFIHCRKSPRIRFKK